MFETSNHQKQDQKGIQIRSRKQMNAVNVGFGKMLCSNLRFRFNPHPQRLTTFHVVLGGRRKFVLRKPSGYYGSASPGQCSGSSFYPDQVRLSKTMNKHLANHDHDCNQHFSAMFLFILLPRMWRSGLQEEHLVTKCSATLASVAAPPPGGRQGFGSPEYLQQCQDNCYRSTGRGATGSLAGAKLRHPCTVNCGKSHDRSVATLWSATSGEV